MYPYFETPPKMTVSITNTCNLECSHCYADCTKTPSARELSLAEWLAFIDYLVENQFIELYIEGGEPLLRPGFDKILERCAQKMMTHVRTNGTLVTKDVAQQWKALGVGRVFVDIMAATAKTHDHLSGVRGSFRKSCNAVGLLSSVGIPTDMVIIMNRYNVAELPKYLLLARELGAKRVGVLRLYPLGRAKRRWADLALSLEEQEGAVAMLRPPEGLSLMQSWHPRDANCCWQAATVNSYGDSIGCPYLREYVNFGNIRMVPFLETWRDDPLYRSLRSGKVEKACSSCSTTQGSHGGCRSTAYAYHGRWTAPDPFCGHLNDKVDLRVLPNWLLQDKPEPENSTDT